MAAKGVAFGYQPAQNWLKDRKGRRLDYGQIEHWQRIIVALTESDRLMGEIDGEFLNPRPKLAGESTIRKT